MPRTWTKTEAFEHFGTQLTNVRWSWSGVATDGGVVVLVLWTDAVKPLDGRIVYIDEDDLDAEWRRRPGHADRVRHLLHCRDKLGGRFRAVLARAADEDADPREIAACFPQQDVWWQIDELNEATGAFRAHAVRAA